MANRRTMIHELCPQLYDVGVTYFGYYNNKTVDKRLSVHDHGSCYELCYLDKGMQPYYIHSGKGDSEAKQYRLYGGEVFITRPYERHSSGDFEQLRGCMYWINVDVSCPTLLGQTESNAALIRKALSGLTKRILPVPHSVSARLTEAFMLLATPNEERLFRACQLLCLFITELAAQDRMQSVERHSGRSLTAKGIEAVSFIDSNLLDPELGVQMIAEHLHYSRSYLMTVFRHEIGMTLHEYILSRKIEYSKELLETNSITDTAFLLNFSSSQHFSRVFKERTNLTPREYVLFQQNNKG